MQLQKICIIHLNQIGDLVFSLPLLKALRDNFPEAAIHSVVKPFLKELLADSPFVDRIILRGNSFKEKIDLLRKIRRNRYELLISLGRSEESLLLASMSAAKIKAGFAHFFWDLALDVKENIEGHNSWYNYAKLLRRLQIRITKNDYVGLLNINNEKSISDLPDEFAVISPAASARRQMKAWDPGKFADLIVSLQQHFNLRCVLVGGAEDHAYNDIIIENVKKRAGANSFEIVNLTGNTGLACLCSILKQARLFVGIDSGIMHLASSLDIPVVGLFGPTDPKYVGPQNLRSTVISNRDMDCVPCYLKSCDHRNCLNELTVARVFEACRQLLTTAGN
jgi:lipopolysaccharide heptosyltransferase II